MPVGPRISNTTLAPPDGIVEDPLSWREDRGAGGHLLPPRYEDLGPIGAGGMGEVRRVMDRDFRRVLAMKILHPDFLGNARLVSRFVAEAQLTAQLQHPAIVPVQDMGRLEDGRVYFTMRLVEGRTLAAAIAEAHAHGAARSLRPLVDAFHRVCEAVAYAHARGVVHRDLKPENVLLGEYGDVAVIDWGLARVLSRTSIEEPVVTDRSLDPTKGTLAGAIAGTPAYMPPEQARGSRDVPGPQVDVYALGAVLYEVLAGRPPYDGDDPHDILASVVAGPPPELDAPDLPRALVEIAARAMARDPEDRYSSARPLEAAVQAWLEGSERRDRANRLLSQAHEKARQVEGLLARARALRVHVDARVSQPDSLRPARERAVEAERLEQGAKVLEAVATQLANAALAQDPELPDAHRFLADVWYARHREAELRRDVGAAQAWAVLLGAHDRGRYARYLKGDGSLSLVTDPPGARVTFFRFDTEHGRWAARPWGRPVTTPIRDMALPMGSYLLLIERPGHLPVRYPVFIGREEAWSGAPPASAEPWPIRLPSPDDLGPDEIYVPAGWTWAGAQPDAPRAPLEKRWVSGFVITRHPVTNGQYLEFLGDLRRRFRVEEAESYAPGPNTGRAETVLAFRRGRHGDHSMQGMDAAAPVVNVDWQGASAFAAWRAIRDKLAWRLPAEAEREKAARGADGRPFPWGSELDPAESCTAETTPRRVSGPCPISAFPLDESPYGVSGLAGNVMDWCRDPWRPGADGSHGRVVRGGSWDSAADECRTTARARHPEHARLPYVGIRLVRPFDREGGGR